MVVVGSAIMSRTPILARSRSTTWPSARTHCGLTLSPPFTETMAFSVVLPSGLK